MKITDKMRLKDLIDAVLGCIQYGSVSGRGTAYLTRIAGEHAAAIRSSRKRKEGR